MSEFSLLRFSDDPVKWGPQLIETLLQWDIEPMLQYRLLAISEDQWKLLRLGQMNAMPMGSITRTRLILSITELTLFTFLTTSSINYWLHQSDPKPPFNHRRPRDFLCSGEVSDLIELYRFLMQPNLNFGSSKACDEKNGAL